jgi:prevent-host-death family protein
MVTTIATAKEFESQLMKKKIKEVDTVYARKNFAEITSRAAYGGDPIIITYRNNARCAVISMDDFEKLRGIK